MTAQTTATTNIKNRITNVIYMDRDADHLEYVINRMADVTAQYHIKYEQLFKVRVKDVQSLYPDCETRRFFVDAQCRYEISDLYDTCANGGGWQYKIEYTEKSDIKQFIYGNEYVYTWEVIN